MKALVPCFGLATEATCSERADRTFPSHLLTLPDNYLRTNKPKELLTPFTKHIAHIYQNINSLATTKFKVWVAGEKKSNYATFKFPHLSEASQISLI